MSSIIKDDFNCPGCHVQFCTDTGNPRILACGHCLCSNCLGIHNFSSAVQCEECQSEALYNNISDIPVAYMLKALIEKLQLEGTFKNTPKTFNDNILINLPNKEAGENLASVGTCTEHNSPLHFGCLTCEEWLCGTCVCLKHSSDKTNCNVALIHEAIQQKKEELRKHLDDSNSSLGLLKSETKLCITITEELLSFVTKHISLNEKYQNELDSRQSALIKQEKHLKVLDEVATELEAALSLSETTEKLKQTLNIYFNKKDIFTKNLVKNELFRTWKHWIRDNARLQDTANAVFVPWKDWNNEKFLLNLKVKSREVIMTMRPDYGETLLIVEPSFFSYSSNFSHAFIDLRYQSTGRELPRLTFLLDDNPLAQEFMKHCCIGGFGWNNFEKSSACHPSRSCDTLIFGERECQPDPKMVNVGSKDQYLKPVNNGAIGIYNNFENTEEVDVANMVVYIHMCQDEEESPLPQNLQYISYGEEPKLKNSFGSVYAGFDYLQYRPHDELNSKMFVSDCGVIADYVSEDEEDS